MKMKNFSLSKTQFSTDRFKEGKKFKEKRQSRSNRWRLVMIFTIYDPYIRRKISQTNTNRTIKRRATPYLPQNQPDGTLLLYSNDLTTAF